MRSYNITLHFQLSIRLLSHWIIGKSLWIKGSWLPLKIYFLSSLIFSVWSIACVLFNAATTCRLYYNPKPLHLLYLIETIIIQLRLGSSSSLVIQKNATNIIIFSQNISREHIEEYILSSVPISASYPTFLYSTWYYILNVWCLFSLAFLLLKQVILRTRTAFLASIIHFQCIQYWVSHSKYLTTVG